MTTPMNGKPQTRTISRALPVNATLLEVVLLALLGAMAVVLRAYLRLPLQLPGRHGLEVMAILMIGRKASSLPFAMSISTLTGGLMALFPFLGFSDPFMLPVYLIMGAVTDLAYTLFNPFRVRMALFVVLGGIAYMMIPLCRILIEVTGLWHYQSLYRAGFLYPVLTHFLFGAGGTTLATTVALAAKKIRK
jgi:hypothetical protein